MNIKSKSIYCIFVTLNIVFSITVNAAGTKPVESGAVIRGVTLSGAAGAPGTPTKRDCDFSKEEVGFDGKMIDASVNCKLNGTVPQVLQGLPPRFNAYCVYQKAPVKSATIIKSPLQGNPNHCLLGGITPKDAKGQFKGAVWK